MSDPSGDQASEDQARLSAPVRWAYFVGGITLPLIGLLGAQVLPDPSHQSGGMGDYAVLVIKSSVGILAPLAAYSMISLALLIVSPRSFGQMGGYFVVRFGVYSGILLAAQLAILSAFAMSSGQHAWRQAAIILILDAGIVMIALGGPWLGRRVIARFGGERFSLAMIVLGLGAFVAAFLASKSVMVVVLTIVLAPLVGIAGWVMSAYLRMSIRMLKRRPGKRGQFSLANLLWCSSWLGIDFAICRMSVLRALERYSELPTEPPTCYVCSAAARGHGIIVRSRVVRLCNGRVVCINDQMRYLKSAELALSVVVPRLHRLCRLVYDRVGPAAARLFVWRTLADVAYCLLKPAEWLARACFSLAPEIDQAARRVYGPRAGGKESSILISWQSIK